MSIIDQLDGFLAEPVRNAWLEEGHLKIYVRKGNEWFRGRIGSCFTLANCQTHPHGHTRTGLLKPIFLWMDKQLSAGHFELLKAEQVMHSRMVGILEKHHWETDDSFVFDAEDLPVECGSYWKWAGDWQNPVVHDT